MDIDLGVKIGLNKTEKDVACLGGIAKVLKGKDALQNLNACIDK